MNDTDVRQVSLKTVLQQSAYQLFYVKEDALADRAVTRGMTITPPLSPSVTPILESKNTVRNQSTLESQARPDIRKSELVMSSPPPSPDRKIAKCKKPSVAPKPASSAVVTDFLPFGAGSSKVAPEKSEKVKICNATDRWTVQMTSSSALSDLSTNQVSLNGWNIQQIDKVTRRSSPRRSQEKQNEKSKPVTTVEEDTRPRFDRHAQMESLSLLNSHLTPDLASTCF